MAVVGLLAVAGCSSSVRTMHGNGPVSAGNPGGMMNGGGAPMPGYHYSLITCAVPALTASTVQVVLGDMGLTSMMGGIAPMGAHMMLRSSPNSASAGVFTFVAVNRGWRTPELVILPLAAGSMAEAFRQFSFPTRWFYDVLRALEYFRAVGDPPDERTAEAVQLVRDKQRPDGTWLLENTHPGDIHFELEDGDGRPSRWNTLRALRVLRWAGGD